MDELAKKLNELSEKMEKAIVGSADAAGLKAEIVKLQEDLVKLKVEMEGVKTSYASKIVSLPGLEFEAKKFSLLRAVSAIVTRNWNGAEFEREVFQNTAKSKDGVAKVMSTESDSAGGFVVPTQVLGDFIEMLRANLVTRALGATYIDGLIGSPVEVSGQSGGATTMWIGEDNATGITASDLTLRQNQMTPHMCGAIVKLSNRLLRMSNPAIETLVRNDVALAMADAIDQAALSGTGAAAQPLGIQNVPSIPTYDMTSVVTKKVHIWTALMELEAKLAEANALRGKLGFAFNPRVKKYLSQARVGAGSEDGAGGFVADPLTSAQLASYIGYPFQSTTNLAITTSTTPDESQIIFGNWAELIIGSWAGLSILASQEASTAFATNQTWVRFVQEVDTMVRHKESFVVGQHCSMELTS